MKDSEPSVTQRFIAEALPVTQIYPQSEQPSHEAVTLRFSDAEDMHDLQPDGIFQQTAAPLLAEHYRIIKRNLGGISGEAEVFHCHDVEQDSEVVFKWYRYDATPKTQVIEQLQGLVHPHIVSLQSYGQWQGRFYEVMEYCRGGSMADHMPYREEDLRAALPGIVSGLHYCHEQGIIHRDIKPNNLFLRSADLTSAQLGDFGISSYLDKAQFDNREVRVTESASRLTLDYAAPELLDGHQVSPKTDYYALGISLIHLFLGHSPYHGMSHNDILVAHLRARLPLPEHTSPSFAHLLRGLTHSDPAQRWGYEQCMAWLRGATVPQVNADPWAEQAKPYPGLPDADTPQKLALQLDNFAAFEQLINGDIRRWVFDNFSAELAEQLKTLAQDFADCDKKRQPVALVKLRYLLYPQATLRIGKLRLNNLEALLNVLLRKPDASQRRVIEEALWHEEIETWVQAGQHAGQRSDELLAKIHALRARLRFTRFEGVALFALFYTLHPSYPLNLGKDLSVNHPNDFADAFKKQQSQAAQALRQLLYSKRLEEWLRATEFDGWEADVKFINDLRERYLDRQELGSYMVRCRFQPDLAFPFAGKAIKTPQQLARIIDSSEENWAKGRELLEQEWLRAWLLGTGRVQSALDFDHAMLMVDASWDRKLESVLRMLDPQLAAPQLSVAPHKIDFGFLPADSPPQHQILRISNQSRGYLSGHIILEHYGQGIELDEYNIEGSTEVRVSLDLSGCEPGRWYENHLEILTTGGQQRVAISYRLRSADKKQSWWQRFLLSRD